MHYDAKQFLRDRFARIVRGTVVRDDAIPTQIIVTVIQVEPPPTGGRRDR